MAGGIPTSFIDDVLARTDIVELIDSRVKLKKAGREYQACCPFHGEKTPSFSVSPQKQFYYCFGCHASGNAISFLMEYEKLEFVEAVQELAARLGLEVPFDNSFNKNGLNFQAKRSLQDLMEDIVRFYQVQLYKSPEAMNYLSHRGLSDEIIKRFAIGFASQKYSEIRDAFGQKKKENIQKLKDLGMLAENERGTYDRFRQRIMFPIRDRQGKTIGFGGRIIGDGQPKYLNSPETKLFHKGNGLYGLYESLQSNSHPDKLLVVEGYMDVVALAQYGVDYAVASLGTATTPEQLKLAFRSTDQIVCCYDADRAGRAAAWRALENALPLLEDGRQLKFMFLPDGEDPDSFIRQYGKEGFEQQLEQAQSLSEFLFKHLSAQVDFSSREGKAKLVSLAKPLIQKIPGETLQLTLKDILGQKVGIFDKYKLDELMGSIQHSTKPKIMVDNGKITRTPMRLLITLLLQNPRLVKLIPDLTILKQLDEKGFDLFEALTNYCLAHVGTTTGQILEYWRGKDYYKSLEILASWDHLVTDDNLDDVFLETLSHFYRQVIDNRIEELIAKERSNNEELTVEEKYELQELLMKKQQKNS